MKTVAIILAAGQGKRMNTNTPKQYLPLDGRPVLFYSLEVFQNSDVDEIILVTEKDQIEYCRKEIVEHYGFDKVKNIVAGGAERYESVYNGLHAISSANVVLIHDGARPFVTDDIIKRSIETALKTGACVVGTKVKDTIKEVNENHVAINTPTRDHLWQVQTPQSFQYGLIYHAYERMKQENAKDITDDAMVMERYGTNPVTIIEGDYRNIKVTTPEDMIVAQAFLNVRKNRNQKN